MNKKTAEVKAFDLMKEIKRNKVVKNEFGTTCGCPVTLEGCIRHLILKSPSMIQYRDDALNLLYCILGTSINWQDGKLFDASPNNYLNMPPAAGGQGCWSRDFGMSEAFDFMNLPKLFRMETIDVHIEELRNIVLTIEEIDERQITYRKELNYNFYPISWFSCNLCVPSNVKRDFYDGAVETIELILKSKPERGTNRWLDFQKTKVYANEIFGALKTHKFWGK